MILNARLFGRGRKTGASGRASPPLGESPAVVGGAASRSQGGVKPLALQDAVAWFGLFLRRWKQGGV
jgi:hypothetical protein